MKAKTIIKKNKKDKKGNCPVYLRISNKGRSIDVSMQVKVNPMTWDPAKERVSGYSESVRSQNAIIQEYEDRFLKVMAQATRSQKRYPLEKIKSALIPHLEETTTVFSAIDRYYEHIAERFPGITRQGTLDKLRALKKHLEEYFVKSQTSKSIECDSFSEIMLEKFLRFLKTEKGLKHNSAAKHVKAIKTAFNFNVKLGTIKSNPVQKFRLTHEPVRRSALDLYSLRQLEELQLENQSLRRTLDLFLFSCYTGISFGDVQSLDPRSIQPVIIPGELTDLKMIIRKRKKSGVEYRAIIIPEAMEIVERYRNDPDCIKSDRLLPQMSNQVCNRRLKEIAKLTDIIQSLTFHISRYTCASILLRNEVPMQVIMKMLGHTKQQMTTHYQDIYDETYFSVAKKFEGGFSGDWIKADKRKKSTL